MSYANYSISYSNEFEITRMSLYGIIGAFAVSSHILCMYLTVRQSSKLSSEYVNVLLILKIFQLLYDLQTCIFFIIAPVFPCKAVFLKGLGVYLGLNAHIPFVINLTTLSLIAAWFNCCLFHRHQVILPFNHRAKLHPRGIYVVYFIMNVVMMLNPVSFIFTTKNDVEIQEPIIANSPMAWLLDVPSFKIYTDENCPLIMRFRFPLLLSSVRFIMGILRSQKPDPIVKPRPSRNTATFISTCAVAYAGEECRGRSLLINKDALIPDPFGHSPTAPLGTRNVE
ncbi:hypothetical protein PRIPAC_81789 [Pristionchus pacificus]|uniref:G protein-coupled receptor n=1 Tax=Pristionchus pacificus TaxID=54126 RepID=A0A2A6CQH4_PRIPA|nr:hypothetical protein PRIPAC_81789 [Pristionchus pacificus]|eukprot:PDM80370.1 G protein-coupled receptor [Pristionchus pacificus]